MPGGRKEVGDNNSFETALRETREEVGLDLNCHGRYLGRLSDVTTRSHEGIKPMAVSPFVFAIDSPERLTLSNEAKEIVSIPLAYLMQPSNRDTMTWGKLRVPCYHYNDARVWGLTLMMLDELVRLAGGDIKRTNDWLKMFGIKSR